MVELLAIVLVLMLSGARGEAQQAKKTPTVGVLVGGSASSDAVRIEALRQGLRQLGYVETNNLAVEYRYAEGKPDRLTELAAALVRLSVDVIVTAGPTATSAAKNATNTIPIIMAHDADPVGAGFVSNLARPGGNITGLSNLAPEISGKRLELLKEIVPRLSRVAVFGTSTKSTTQTLRETEVAGKALGLQLKYFDVTDAKDIATAFKKQPRDGPKRPLCSKAAF